MPLFNGVIVSSRDNDMHDAFIFTLYLHILIFVPLPWRHDLARKVGLLELLVKPRRVKHSRYIVSYKTFDRVGIRL